MFSWLTKKPAAVKALPLSQREKTYSASSGYVYQYRFLGLAGPQHVFNVSADRQTSFEVRIHLTAEALAPCQERMGSELRWNELYALSKLCLFTAFDSAPAPKSLQQVICPDSSELLAHMSTLNMA